MVVAQECQHWFHKANEDPAPNNKSGDRGLIERWWGNTYIFLSYLLFTSPLAYMEQTAGIVGGKNIIYDKIVSIANALKEDLDYSMFDEKYIGKEAHKHCTSLIPGAATFKDGEEFKALMTTMVNRYDTLKANMGASGKARVYISTHS